jgi:hypothetical protein
MSDDLRRRDDSLLASLDKRLALLEQAHTLEGHAAVSRSQVVERAVDAVSSKVDAAVTLWQMSSADPAASPAGRALLAAAADLKGDLAVITVKVNAHDDFIQQTAGAIRLARWAIGTSLFAVIVQVLQIASAIAQRPPA